LPLYQFFTLVNAGYASEPNGKLGLTFIATELLDKGLRNEMRGQIAEDLEQLGMNFDASTEADYSFIKISAFHGMKTRLLKTYQR